MRSSQDRAGAYRLRLQLVQGERLKPELGDARLRARKEERAAGSEMTAAVPEVAWIGAVLPVTAAFHECRSSAASDARPSGAWYSSATRALRTVTPAPALGRERARGALLSALNGSPVSPWEMLVPQGEQDGRELLLNP
jgi:hypothetical protein